ncbi:MAG TPA: family 43 glycosylhydrolase, partial [Sphingomonas sp.]
MKPAAFLPLLLLGASGPERSGAIFEGADPAALVADGRVWLYPTGGTRPLRVWSSSDLVRWERGPELLQLGDARWIERTAPFRQLWAPHMAAANGRYYLYYSVGPQEPRPARIGVAVCDTPAGPCRDSGRPLIDGEDSERFAGRPARGCADGMTPTGSGRYRFEAIDPMVFVDPASGRRMLYAGGSNGATLRVWELAPDMTTLEREVAVEQPPCFTEAPWMHERHGTYYLSYSSGHWDRSDYSVRYATAPTPTGPWTYRGAILRSAGRNKGPGHHGFFADPHTGGTVMAYHRWEGQPGDGPYRAKRKVALARVAYRADGTIAPVAPE